MDIMAYLIERLRAAGPSRWEAIAAACDVAKTLPRKIVYGDRENPGVQTIQPLVNFFEAVERGERELPEPAAKSEADAEPEERAA